MEAKYFVGCWTWKAQQHNAEEQQRTNIMKARAKCEIKQQRHGTGNMEICCVFLSIIREVIIVVLISCIGRGGKRVWHYATWFMIKGKQKTSQHTCNYKIHASVQKSISQVQVSIINNSDEKLEISWRCLETETGRTSPVISYFLLLLYSRLNSASI